MEKMKETCAYKTYLSICITALVDSIKESTEDRVGIVYVSPSITYSRKHYTDDDKNVIIRDKEGNLPERDKYYGISIYIDTIDGSPVYEMTSVQMPGRQEIVWDCCFSLFSCPLAARKAIIEGILQDLIDLYPEIKEGKSVG